MTEQKLATCLVIPDLALNKALSFLLVGLQIFFNTKLGQSTKKNSNPNMNVIMN